MKEELHRILLGRGYRYRPAFKMKKESLLYSDKHRKGFYIKKYVTEEGDFSVALDIKDDPYTCLPSAWVINIPIQLEGKLIPHISSTYYLCYVEQMEADWNSNDLDSTYRDVDEQIQKTLNDAVASDLSIDIELEGEFANYWNSDEDIYLLDKLEYNKTFTTRFSEKRSLDDIVSREYITINSSETNKQDPISAWINVRGINIEYLSDISITTHYIMVNSSRLVGAQWPPNNLYDILKWLTHIDHNARNNVIQKIISDKTKRRIIFLEVKGQDCIAFYFELNLQAIDINRHSSNKTRKTSFLHLASLLGGNRSTLNFKRLNVIQSDKSTLLSRNQFRPNVGNLSDKKIALIGCGTIGGYLADLLLRSGAGCGNKYFHLYDSDDFKPHNFARHALTVCEFGKNKATALGVRLRNTIHISKNIQGFSFQFPINKKVLLNYDIVIDATGRPPVSKRLAAIVRELENNKRPILIHAFNDGNGRASKVLLDNGSCCYACMVNNSETHKNNIDLRFKDIDSVAENRISCGTTYTPYDAAVSHMTAALAQEAILNTLELKMPWTYNEHMFDGSRTRKQKLLKRQQNCPICHEK